MSVSDPLLKDLKGCILELTRENEENSIKDYHPILEELCETLESIFRKGLISTQPSPFGLTKKDYWSWMQSSLSNSKQYSLKFKMSFNKILDCPRVMTAQGRGRLFVRQALLHKCLHIPVEQMVRNRDYDKIYNQDSIVGEEILGEIFLSLTYQLSQLNFDLIIENAAFLDTSWSLPQYKQYEMVPCLDLGMYLGHVKGWAVVLKVDDGSIAAEDNKIEKGDVVDEIFGVCIKGWRKSRIMSFFKQNKGLPIPLKVIKSRNLDGTLYVGLIPILRILQLDVDEDLPTDSEESTSSDFSVNGPLVDFLGSVEVGNTGDVSLIEHAVSTILSRNEPSVPVVMVAAEIGVQSVLKSSRKILLNHSYTEISACGRRNDTPLLFGYIAGDSNCSMCTCFTCYVFRAPTDSVSRDILLTLSDGFHRTHWAV